MATGGHYWWKVLRYNCFCCSGPVVNMCHHHPLLPAGHHVWRRHFHCSRLHLYICLDIVVWKINYIVFTSGTGVWPIKRKESIETELQAGWVVRLGHSYFLWASWNTYQLSVTSLVSSLHGNITLINTISMYFKAKVNDNDLYHKLMSRCWK